MVSLNSLNSVPERSSPIVYSWCHPKHHFTLSSPMSSSSGHPWGHQHHYWDIIRRVIHNIIPERSSVRSHSLGHPRGHPQCHPGCQPHPKFHSKVTWHSISTNQKPENFQIPLYHKNFTMKMFNLKNKAVYNSSSNKFLAPSLAMIPKQVPLMDDITSFVLDLKLWCL